MTTSADPIEADAPARRPVAARAAGPSAPARRPGSARAGPTEHDLQLRLHPALEVVEADPERRGRLLARQRVPRNGLHRSRRRLRHALRAPVRCRARAAAPARSRARRCARASSSRWRCELALARRSAARRAAAPPHAAAPRQTLRSPRRSRAARLESAAGAALAAIEAAVARAPRALRVAARPRPARLGAARSRRGHRRVDREHLGRRCRGAPRPAARSDRAAPASTGANSARSSSGCAATYSRLLSRPRLSATYAHSRLIPSLASTKARSTVAPCATWPVIA